MKRGRTQVQESLPLYDLKVTVFPVDSQMPSIATGNECRDVAAMPRILFIQVQTLLVSLRFVKRFKSERTPVLASVGLWKKNTESNTLGSPTEK